MAEQTVEALVEGGKATAAPPLGPALGPLGVNIGQVVSEINKKTSAFNGMQVPVKIIVDITSKSFQISVGTPPTSSLIKKETGIEKGASNPKTDKVADILIEQLIKIALMKQDSLSGRTLKEKVKEVMGTCNSMGILVEGKTAVESIKEVNLGKFDKEIAEQKTELTSEEKAKLEEQKKKLAREIEKRKADIDAKAKDIISKMQGKERAEIKAKLVEAGIPDYLIKELLPMEGEAAKAEKPKEAAAVKLEKPKETEKKEPTKEKGKQ